MLLFIDALKTHAFLQHALIAGLLVSVACGVIGSYVVVKRIGYLAGGIAHAVLGGMGVAYFFGADPMNGALACAVLVALLIGAVKLYWGQQEDTTIGALWAVGMALGVVMISQTPGYSVDLMSYLFGNILMVPASELWRMGVLDLCILGIVALFQKQFLAVTFDEEFARVRGLHVSFFYLLLLVLIALTVVLLIQMVGLILVIAMLTLPAAIAGQYVRTLGWMMALASLLGLLFNAAGLALSYAPGLPAGATIILVAGSAYLLSLLVRGLVQGRR